MVIVVVILLYNIKSIYYLNNILELTKHKDGKNKILLFNLKNLNYWKCDLK